LSSWNFVRVAWNRILAVLPVGTGQDTIGIGQTASAEAAVTPEQKARQKIDRQLDQCGWLVQDYRNMDLSAGLGVAVREFPLTTGHADYLFYLDRRALGVVEAKPEGHTLTGVEIQSAKYTGGLARNLPHYRLPLPFAYESTGVVTQFTNTLDPYPRSREIFTFHRPEELRRLVGLEKQLRATEPNRPLTASTSGGQYHRPTAAMNLAAVQLRRPAGPAGDL
jgi:type I site-specific restriction endonuclease